VVRSNSDLAIEQRQCDEISIGFQGSFFRRHYNAVQLAVTRVISLRIPNYGTLRLQHSIR
jgi:hypothetical protein